MTPNHHYLKQVGHAYWRLNTGGRRFGAWLGPGAHVFWREGGYRYSLLMRQYWSPDSVAYGTEKEAMEQAERALLSRGYWW